MPKLLAVLRQIGAYAVGFLLIVTVYIFINTGNIETALSAGIAGLGFLLLCILPVTLIIWFPLQRLAGRSDK
jgi:hypothetical protein